MTRNAGWRAAATSTFGIGESIADKPCGDWCEAGSAPAAGQFQRALISPSMRPA